MKQPLYIALLLTTAFHAGAGVRSARAEGYGSADFVGPGNTVLRAAAQQSGATSFFAVGRTWTGSQYKALIAAYRTSDGSQDLTFAAAGGTPGRLVLDLAGSGYDNLCNGVVSLGSNSYLAACRSMTVNRYYDTYLVKFNSSGTLDASFGTNGVVATGHGGTASHSFVRGMALNGSTVAVVGQGGNYSPGVFRPFIATYSTSTGAQANLATITAYAGSAVDVTWSSSSYYVASTEGSGNRSFYIHKFNSTLTESGSPWGTALSFSAAGGGLDSVPSAIRVVGSSAVVVGGTRTDSTSTPWRCAIAAVTTAGGVLDTTFGRNTLSGAVGANDNQGVTLFTHDLDNNYDCILNSFAPDSSNNLFVSGTAYRGSNYDFLTGKLTSAGVLSLLQVQTGGSGDDVANAGIFFDGSYTNYFAVGRMHNGSLYNGGAMTKVVDNSGSGFWTSISTTNSPTGRMEHSGVWSGSRMLVWGGKDTSGTTNTGALFDPVSNTWAPMTTANAPTKRQRHSTIWTGSKMVVFGGGTGAAGLNTGGMYDPGTDKWTATNTNNAPVGRRRHSGVWTSAKMIVFGGESSGTVYNDGGVFDPGSNTWTAMTTTNAPAVREYHEAVWTGSAMVVFGGDDGANPLNTGGVYNPTTDKWTATTTTNAPEVRDNFGSLWTGTRMLVFGGQGTSTSLNTGGLYDPTGDSWTAITTTNAPSLRRQFTMVWTGSKAMLWGGFKSGGGGTYHADGFSYTPSTDSWEPMPSPGLSGRRQNSIIWTGARLILWGGNDGSGTELGDGGNFEADLSFTTYSSNVWKTLATGPTARFKASAAWNGSDMIVFGGMTGTSTYTNTGSRYTASTNSWSATTTTNAPSARINHSALWDPVNSRMIVFGGNNAGSDFNSGSRYDPSATNKWTAVATGNAPSVRDQHSATWTGTHYVVWGGYSGSSALNTGSRYDPAANSWSATTTTNAPATRYQHSAVWTGSNVLIWGGIASGTERNTGSSYDPGTNKWTAITTTNAPQTRTNHMAAWTGDSMIIWGGSDNSTRLATGSLYNVATGLWTAMSTTNAPSGRDEAVSAWTGSRFIVWGGWDGTTTTATGGIYDPYTDTWTALSTTNTPTAVRGASGVWSGSSLLIYGGRSGTTFYDQTRSYQP